MEVAAESARETTGQIELAPDAGIAGLRFDNRFSSLLPADPVPDNRRREVRGAAFSRVAPTAVGHPQTIAVAREVAELLGLNANEALASPLFAGVFSGNVVLPGSDPVATV